MVQDEPKQLSKQYLQNHIFSFALLVIEEHNLQTEIFLHISLYLKYQKHLYHLMGNLQFLLFPSQLDQVYLAKLIKSLIPKHQFLINLNFQHHPYQFGLHLIVDLLNNIFLLDLLLQLFLLNEHHYA